MLTLIVKSIVFITGAVYLYWWIFLLVMIAGVIAFIQSKNRLLKGVGLILTVGSVLSFGIFWLGYSNAFNLLSVLN